MTLEFGGMDSSDRDPVAVPNIIWPLKELLVLTVMYFIYAGLTIGAAEQVKCSQGYNILIAFTFLPLVLALGFACTYIPTKQAMDMASVAISGDVNFSQIPLTFVVTSVIVIGILSSLLGIGGGELLGPVLLSMNILPTVSTATTSVLEVATSLISVITSMVTGTLEYDTALIFFAVGLVGGSVGRTAGLWYAEKYGRGSMLIFVLAVVLLLAQIEYIQELVNGPTSFSVLSFCP
jgi:Sulfite exporter TauE/SafE